LESAALDWQDQMQRHMAINDGTNVKRVKAVKARQEGNRIGKAHKFFTPHNETTSADISLFDSSVRKRELIQEYHLIDDDDDEDDDDDTSGNMEDAYQPSNERTIKRRKLDPGHFINMNPPSASSNTNDVDTDRVELPILTGRSPAHLKTQLGTAKSANANMEDDKDNNEDVNLHPFTSLPMPSVIHSTQFGNSSSQDEATVAPDLAFNTSANKSYSSGENSFKSKRKTTKKSKAELNSDSFIARDHSKQNDGDDNTLAIADDDTVTSEINTGIHGPWTNIYSKVKLFVRVTPRDLRNSEVMICHANDDFFENFRFEKSDGLPIPLKSLFGQGTSRLVLHKLHTALLTGKQASEFINLYRADNLPLACHIVLVSVTGNRAKETVTHSNSENIPNQAVIDARNHEKFAVLTIRSASVIGNAKSYGIGFFGPGRIKTVVPASQGNSSLTAPDIDTNHQHQDAIRLKESTSEKQNDAETVHRSQLVHQAGPYSSQQQRFVNVCDFSRTPLTQGTGQTHKNKSHSHSTARTYAQKGREKTSAPAEPVQLTSFSGRCKNPDIYAMQASAQYRTSVDQDHAYDDSDSGEDIQYPMSNWQRQRFEPEVRYQEQMSHREPSLASIGQESLRVNSSQRPQRDGRDVPHPSQYLL
jgi:hypothetical protein